MFACLTGFQRDRLVAAGYSQEALEVLPNMSAAAVGYETDARSGTGFVAYAGRISPEKGIGLLLSAAERLQDIPFRLAGRCDAMPQSTRTLPGNVSFLGALDRDALVGFYEESRFLLLCSTWFEGFPMVILEAMVHARAVIAPRIGGIPEIVDHGVTGLLFESGDADDLAQKVRYLWDHPGMCRSMGRAGREKAEREYSPERHYERLMAIYEKAMRRGHDYA
jgi:glycosyltransferase involved in cell wall biosynthesis